MVVNLTLGRVDSKKDIEGVIVLQTPDEEHGIEELSRQHPRVIEVCREIGITDMSKVYFDLWSLGYDERWGVERRLVHGIPYHRTSSQDNQYAHPLDFTLVVDREKKEVLAVDVRLANGERTQIPAKNHNYLPQFLQGSYTWDRLKSIEITQPRGVSFRLNGNELEWANLRCHVGFNYREGIVLSDIRMSDPYDSRERTIFNRISIAEMIVPYRERHAFDVGEYGNGLLTNSLQPGCDCKGAIQYLDAILSDSDGKPYTIKNAVCIHEEDNGLLYKHTDFRDNTTVSARDRKLIISHIITVANYEYGFYHNFSLDGTYDCEVKLTGCLSTSSLHPSQNASPHGTEVAEGVTAPNHQHIFSLRVDPAIDSNRNTVVQNDIVILDGPSWENAMYSKKTPLRTALAGASDYCHETGRTWDITSPNHINPTSKSPIAYKIVNNSCPPLLARPGGRLSKRADFARHSLWVVPYQDHRIFPAGQYVCQRSGDCDNPDNSTISDWAQTDKSIENTDIVCYIQFGVTHIPRPEDFPIMPVEKVGTTIRASHFFNKNPCLWVPPSGASEEPGARL